MGNVSNKEVLASTFVEVTTSTAECEPSWEQLRKSMEWTVESLGVKQYNLRKFELVDSKFVGRWPHYRDYEMTNVLFNQTSTSFLPTNASISVWKQSRTLWFSYVDFTHPAAADHVHIIQESYELWKVLKDKSSEHFADLSLLMLPKNDSDGAPGECALCPGGLANPPLKKLKTEMVEIMLRPMRDSKTFKDLSSACSDSTPMADAADASNEAPKCLKDAASAAPCKNAKNTNIGGKGRGRGGGHGKGRGKGVKKPSKVRRCAMGFPWRCLVGRKEAAAIP
jgi:hypothetical protein